MSTKIDLSKITKLELREVWETEDKDFTPWLAEEENITELGKTIGIELEVEAQEKNVGPFRADILARDISANHYVLIENQLDLTDHKHLGQIMTYAAGLDAFTIIWIAKQFTEEHRAAVDWLNRITDEGINFFGIEIEVLKIGDSLAAPQFKIVAKPNDWTRSVKKAANDSNLSDTKIKQRNYWTALKEYVSDNGNPFKMQKPLPQHWTNIALGKSGFHLSLTVNSQKKQVTISFEINTESAKDNKKYFDILKEKYKESSKTDISQNITWMRLDDKKVSLISLSQDFDFLDSDSHSQQFAWFVENVNKFIKFFKPKVKTINLNG